MEGQKRRQTLTRYAILVRGENLRGANLMRAGTRLYIFGYIVRQYSYLSSKSHEDGAGITGRWFTICALILNNIGMAIFKET